MADEQHPYADPWGLPTEDSPDLAPSPRPSEPEPEAASTDQPEPDAATEPEPEGMAEPEGAAEPDAGEVDASANGAEESTLESDEPPEHEGLMSPTQMEAKNVLDTLGAGFDDLPDEPPDWMDATATSAPPSVYRELSDLTRPAGDAEMAEPEVPEEPADVERVGVEENLEPVEPAEGTDVETDLETETIEPLEPETTDVEENLEPIEPAEATDVETDLETETIEPLDLEPVETETIDTETIEPGDEPDLDEAVASALSAIETPDADIEPVETETIDTESIEPGDEPETIDTETIEPGDEPDLDEAVASALSAVEPSNIQDTQVEPGLIESASVAWGSTWGSAAQGWVRHDGGRSTWRPIVTTTSDVGAWEVDTFLGIVAGDATVAETGNLAGARKAALQALVDEALSRGAHAVVGVRTAVHEVGRSVVFSAVGTAVTLRNPS